MTGRSDAWAAVAQASEGAGRNGGALALGSDSHKERFCRMLLDTSEAWEAARIAWPALDDEAQARLTGLPIWDIAVATEGKASKYVLSYAATVGDPLLGEALRRNAFEEARHGKLLSAMVARYGIALGAVAPCAEPQDPEWAFMVTGYSECIDSFFAFGLFAAARQSGFFPIELVQVFEPVMQEECRHILFFVNWAAWHRRNLPWWPRARFAAKTLGVWLFLIWERIKTARDIGGGSNFTAIGHEPIGVDLGPAQLLQLCLSENERRFIGYDDALPRPALVPRLARLACRLLLMTQRRAAPQPSPG
jgi:hypothetical protein